MLRLLRCTLPLLPPDAPQLAQAVRRSLGEAALLRGLAKGAAAAPPLPTEPADGADGADGTEGADGATGGAGASASGAAAAASSSSSSPPPPSRPAALTPQLLLALPTNLLAVAPQLLPQPPQHLPGNIIIRTRTAHGKALIVRGTGCEVISERYGL